MVLTGLVYKPRIPEPESISPAPLELVVPLLCLVFLALLAVKCLCLASYGIPSNATPSSESSSTSSFPDNALLGVLGALGGSSVSLLRPIQMLMQKRKSPYPVNLVLADKNLRLCTVPDPEQIVVSLRLRILVGDVLV